MFPLTAIKEGDQVITWVRIGEAGDQRLAVRVMHEGWFEETGRDGYWRCSPDFDSFGEAGRWISEGNRMDWDAFDEILR